MLNMKKILVTGTVLTALCASAFAADKASEAPKAPQNGTGCIISDDGTCHLRHIHDANGDFGGRHHKGPRGPLTDEQKAEITKNMTAEEKSAFEKRQQEREQRIAERDKRRAEWEKMSPEERQKARQDWRAEEQKRRAERKEAAMNKLTDEQKAEVEDFIKDDMENRQERRERIKKMTPEQREVIGANRPARHYKGDRGYGHHGDFRGDRGPGFHHNNVDCNGNPDCPANAAK